MAERSLPGPTQGKLFRPPGQAPETSPRSFRPDITGVFRPFLGCAWPRTSVQGPPGADRNPFAIFGSLPTLTLL